MNENSSDSLKQEQQTVSAPADRHIPTEERDIPDLPALDATTRIDSVHNQNDPAQQKPREDAIAALATDDYTANETADLLRQKTAGQSFHATPSDEQATIRSNTAPLRRDEPSIPTIDTLIPLHFGEDYTAILSSADDRHIYTFRITERGYLQYTVNHPEMHNFKGWEATLFQAYYLNGVSGEIGYRPLNQLRTTALNQTEASPTIGLMPGEYRIVVKAVSGVSPDAYKLNAVFTAAQNHEIECNDTKAAYTELYPGIPMVGSASCYPDKQDNDWYLLRVQRDGKARLTFSHESSDSTSIAWRVVLYDENGTELYSENSGLFTETVDSGEIGLRAGVYFVAVLCRTRCDYDYTLTVTTSADNHFEFESNDDFDNATPLQLGGTVSGCVTAKAGKLDRDYYRFETPARGNFALVFTHPPAALEEDKNGWRIRLLTENNEIMYTMISTWNASADRMPVLGLEAGVYYIEVCSEDMYRSTLTYTVIAGSNESTGFEMEPNNTIASANPIAQGVPITGTIINGVDPDDDYFVFSVSAYSRVTVELKHEATAGDRDIFSFSVCDGEGVKAPLYTGREPMKDVNGNNVYYVKSLAGQQNAVGYYELSPGTYYIKVTSGRFFDSINYNILFYIN